MSAFEKLAQHLVTEVPVTRLQDVIATRAAFGVGGICGANCPGAGDWCGLSCQAARADAPNVIDRDGLLEFSASDLEDIRNDLPKLRQAIAVQVESQLNLLR
jgi:hypothetical protein